MTTEITNQNDSLTQESLQRFGLIQHSKVADLLIAKPISIQISECGEDNVKKLLCAWIIKCYTRLGFEINPAQTSDFQKIAILTEDLLEMYPTDSLEDIRESLKKGGQGTYPYGHEKRGVLTMQTVKPWITLHLEEKAEARAVKMQSIEADKTHPLDIDHERLEKEGQAYLKEYENAVRNFYNKGKSFLKRQKEIDDKYTQGPVINRRKEESYAQFKESEEFRKNREEQKYLAWEEELKKYSIEELKKAKMIKEKDTRLVKIIDNEIKSRE